MENIDQYLILPYFEEAFEFLTTQMKENVKVSLDLQLYKVEHKNEVLINDFYESYIKTYNFLNYPSLFYNQEFFQVQKKTSLRKMNLLSFETELLYHSLGLRIKDLVLECVQKKKAFDSKSSTIQVFSGRCLNESMRPTGQWYDEWKQFSKNIKANIEDRIGYAANKKILIKTDIKNFFYSINHEKLIKEIERNAINGILSAEDKQLIRDLLFFIVKNDVGLPVSLTGVTSNFLSNLFLYSLDSYAVEQYKRVFPFLGQMKYHRYVDDIFIIMDIPADEVNPTDISGKLIQYLSDIHNFANNNLGIGLNLGKSKIVFLDKDNYEQELLETTLFGNTYSKPFSPLDENKKPVKNVKQTANNIIDILNRSYDKFMSGQIELVEEKEISLLKRIWDNDVSNYLNKFDMKIKLAMFFDKMEMAYLGRMGVSSVIKLFLKQGRNQERFKEYLLKEFDSQKKFLHYVFLLKYGLELDLTDLINKIRKAELDENDHELILLRRIYNYQDENSNLKWIDWISDEDCECDPSFTRQVFELLRSESKMNYNLAYNHIVNIFQIKVKKVLRGYDKTFNKGCTNQDLADALAELNLISQSSYIEIFKLGNIRNNNGISHGGDVNYPAKSVDSDTYVK